MSDFAGLQTSDFYSFADADVVFFILWIWLLEFRIHADADVNAIY